MEACFGDFCTYRNVPYASRLRVSTSGFAWMSPTSLAPAIPAAGSPSLLRHSIASSPGTGISTRYPSTTPLGLALGPDLPRADEPSSGNLGFSVRGFVTHVPVLTPAFSLPDAPHVLAIMLPRCQERSPTTYTSYKSIASVLCLAPVNFRRRVIRLVSCYALFKGWLLLSQPPSCLDISTSFST